ncbi:MAG: hypothetical protein IT164_12980 [Bryobacterales bacterium]|nr:hypothetical protein [Bryobacterales bacterium]
MQVLQAGSHKLLYLELEEEVIQEILTQLGLEARLSNDQRVLTLELQAPGRQAPLLLFDAADPGNLGWFSRCQFYVDGKTATVLQTPIRIANVNDGRGHPVPNALRVQIAKELPPNFRLPGKNPVNEQSLYGVLFNFLSALLNTGVAVCGGSLVKPLAGRGDADMRG